MEERELMIQRIQEAVDGCARHWAELIADHLLAHDFHLVPPKKVPQPTDLTGKCGSCAHAVAIRTSCYVTCPFFEKIRSRTQQHCKNHYQPINSTKEGEAT